MKDGLRLGGIFTVTCHDKTGKTKWEEKFHNTVVNDGINHVLDILFSGSTQVNPWYLGLTDGTPTVAATDTMASHAGWSEVVAYSEATRQEFVDVRSSQSVSNSASPASYSVNGPATVGGVFLSSDNAKSGTAGTLLSAEAFTGGDRTVADGDTVKVTYTFTGANS